MSLSNGSGFAFRRGINRLVLPGVWFYRFVMFTSPRPTNRVSRLPPILSMCGVLLGLTASVSRGQSPSISSAYAVLREASGGPVFFDLLADTANPDFTNTVATLYTSEPLRLGAEAATPRYGCNTQEGQVDQVRLYYAVDGGPTNWINLPLVSAINPDLWQEATATGTVDIASALATGIHTLSLYMVATDLNHCIAPGASVRLPSSGSFSARFELVDTPRDVAAADNAGQRGYLAGWTNLSNGGFGYGPWSFLTSVEDGAAGFFLASGYTNPVVSRTKAWGLYANEAGSGGDQIQIAAAFRELNPPLEVGQTLVIEFQHGGIQSGSLSENNPPRTGGWVGFALREAMPPQFGDPDPFSAFGTFQNALMALGFRGGEAEYRAYDLNNTLGYPAGLPYTTNGVRAEVTFTTTNNFTLVLTDLGTGTKSTAYGITPGSLPGVLAIYNRNAEEADALFNNLYVIDGANPDRAAADNAAQAAYNAGWTHGGNGGFGFAPWSIGVAPGAGSAGTFLAENPPNTDLNAIASGGRAWGMYANDTPGGGVQSVLAYRYFAGAGMAAGQAFGAAFEHGGISALNGSVELMMLGEPTFVNEQGEILMFRFNGGEVTFRMFDDIGLDLYASPVPWSDGGYRLHLNILQTNPVVGYALTVDLRAQDRIYRMCGELESVPRGMRFRITDVEDADVYLNHLYLTGLDELAEFLLGAALLPDGRTVVTFDSRSARQYSLQSRPSLVTGSWQGVPGQTNIPGNDGTLALTNQPGIGNTFLRVITGAD